MPLIDGVRGEVSKATLRHWVGYLHEGLSSLDQEVASQLFEDGQIRVSLISSSMCRGVPLSANLVVVMGTQYHDGGENVHTDYHH